MIGGEVAVRDPEIPLQFDGVAGGERDHRLTPERRRPQACAPLISPHELRISVVPFSTSRPHILAVALALIL